MSESPDVKVTKSENYQVFQVTGQLSHISYDGIKLTVINDKLDIAPAVAGDNFKMSKATITREIQCTLDLSPFSLKSWALLLNQELKKYENLFGTILSPEEIQERFKNPGEKK